MRLRKSGVRTSEKGFPYRSWRNAGGQKWRSQAGGNVVPGAEEGNETHPAIMRRGKEGGGSREKTKRSPGETAAGAANGKRLRRARKSKEMNNRWRKKGSSL